MMTPTTANTNRRIAENAATLTKGKPDTPITVCKLYPADAGDIFAKRVEARLAVEHQEHSPIVSRTRSPVTATAKALHHRGITGDAVIYDGDTGQRLYWFNIESVAASLGTGAGNLKGLPVSRRH